MPIGYGFVIMAKLWRSHSFAISD